MPVQGGAHSLNPIHCRNTIIIGKKKTVAGRRLNAPVAGLGNTAILSHADVPEVWQFIAHHAAYCGGVITGPVIDHYHLEIIRGQCLGDEGPQSPLQERCTIVRRHNNAYGCRYVFSPLFSEFV